MYDPKMAFNVVGRSSLYGKYISYFCLVYATLVSLKYDLSVLNISLLTFGSKSSKAFFKQIVPLSHWLKDLLISSLLVCINDQFYVAYITLVNHQRKKR
jgi:hypothetical protein